MAIKEDSGLFYAFTPRGEEVSTTLEGLLLKLLPTVPPEKSYAWAEVTEALLGPPRDGHVVTGLADTSS